LAGSLFIVGVSLSENVKFDEILFVNDSKTLTKEKRRVYYNKLIGNNGKKLIEISIQKFNSKEIDKFGLSKCLKIGLENIKFFFKNKNKFIFDGNTNYNVLNIETLIKGDQKVSLISAASIIAKFEKDKEMEKYDKIYPALLLKLNSGYINNKHIEAIIKYGYTDIHRKSYNVKKLKDLKIKDYN
jgi:ribonuclease HII